MKVTNIEEKLEQANNYLVNSQYMEAVDEYREILLKDPEILKPSKGWA